MTGTSPIHHSDFNVALTSLASGVQNAMVSWHNTRTASLRAGSESVPRARNLFAPVTKSLQNHWKEIMQYLQRCHTFSGDAIIWSNSLEEEGPNSDSTLLLEELTSCSHELCLQSEALVRQSDENIECLSSLEPHLPELLRGSITYNATACPQTTQFLGLSYSHNGLEDVSSARAALAEIRASLSVAYQFWTGVSTTCRSLLKSDENILRDRARNLGDTWKEYQERIVEAKVSITRSLDAVAIEPAAPPPSLRRQQRRRGSSKSEASSSSSNLSSPRRIGSLDDEVPNACWRFGLFSVGERKKR
ncbi:hypothetical protein DFH06DRAFT_1178228 [Mycena polygramma]|nr:hypothetical protein DFH06DRAFT_1178228 [Mycena polygramma]